MSNAKHKREVAAHIEFRNRKLPHPVVTVVRPHETTAVAIGAKVLMRKDGKTPRKRKGVLVSWRKTETVARATLVESPSSMGRRPRYEWYSCGNK